MNENENTSVEMQDVADLAPSVETVEVAAQPVEQETPVVEEKPKFSNQDSAFANMRREMEKHKLESAKLKAENEKFAAMMQRFGFNGANTDEILDQANAHYYGKTVEEIKNERIASESAKQEHDAMVEKLKNYEMKEIEAQMANDLAKIQKINPNIQSLDELGEPFFDLIRKGIDGEKAYKLMEIEGLVASQNIRAEQEAIKKLKANSQSSVGSLSSEMSKPKSVSDMTDAEFEEFKKRALRGDFKRV